MRLDFSELSLAALDSISLIQHENILTIFPFIQQRMDYDSKLKHSICESKIDDERITKSELRASKEISRQVAE